MALALLVCSSYSLSEEAVYGSTANAAQDTLNWVMRNVLPQQAGLAVNGVVYRYTTVKETEDAMVVSVQNENALGTGYIFRETDDWTGLPSNTISKAVPINNIDISYWGDGSIDWTGNGQVIDQSVIYTYFYEPCSDPQSNPSCDGYVDPYSVVEDVMVSNKTEEKMIQEELDRKTQLEAQEAEEEERERKEIVTRKKKREEEALEVLLGFVNTSLLSQEQIMKHELLKATNYLPQIYFVDVRGGAYDDVPMLVDKKLPDNKKGLRVGLAAELRHREMVDLQYEE